MIEFRNELLFGVSRVRTSFVDDLGNRETGSGTGFWLRLLSGNICFITNAHNIDAKLRHREPVSLKLDTMFIELRLVTGTGKELTFHKETEFFKIRDDSRLFQLQNADCAIVLPVFEKDTGHYKPHAPFEESDLADEDHFKAKLVIGHEAYFIGFPGMSSGQSGTHKSRAWWDTLWNLPVARSASVASFPVYPFTNEGDENSRDNIRTQDVLLVSGLSFRGSSGSPIIAKEWGVHVMPPLSCNNYVPEKIIGIMSGHWWDERDAPDPFKHSGLSYLTRSTSILHLIRENRL